MSLINDKIKEVEKYLLELEEVIPENLDKYLRNLEKRLACERAFEKIIESVIDLCFIFIKEKNFKMPECDEDVFNILFQEKVISEVLSKKLQDAKGMRNFIIHQYEKVDDELVFEAIQKEIFDDVNYFINQIEQELKTKKGEDENKKSKIKRV